MSDLDNRVSRLEGEIGGMKGIAEALFRLTDQMHADMLGMRQELKADINGLRTELKADIRAGKWERSGIVIGLLTLAASMTAVAASIWFAGIPVA